MHEQRCSQQEQEAEEPLSGGNAVPKEAEEPLSGGNAFPKEAGRFVFCWTRSKRKRPNRRRMWCIPDGIEPPTFGFQSQGSTIEL
ncbi:hypothetical protein PC119_g16623 [Phytophthora cactorum]|nr:hypothetical protein PC119_g16623 [Phytophthora cactorum]KAG3172680.1 hypothetical protein PC128_g18475 [Phytophthora cactorum]